MADDSTLAYRAAVEDVGEILDGLKSFKSAPRKRTNVNVLHGIAMYTRDTARAAVMLVDEGMSPSAAVLTRVCLEHAVVAQWIAISPSGAEDFLKQGDFQMGKLGEAARSAGIQIPDDVREVYENCRGTKSVKDLQTAKRTFDTLDSSGGLYLQYKHLCGFVHPALATMTRYANVDDSQSELALSQQPSEAGAKALLFTLGLSVLLAAVPYLDQVRAKPFKRRLTDISEASQLPMWLTENGAAPKS